ncbi:hypothetical protein TWF281_009712 [Arthrobotrys megalospora]
MNGAYTFTVPSSGFHNPNYPSAMSGSSQPHIGSSQAPVPPLRYMNSTPNFRINNANLSLQTNNLTLQNPNAPPPPKPSLRKVVSNPSLLVSSIRARREYEKQQKELQQLIDDSPLNSTEYEALMREKAFKAATKNFSTPSSVLIREPRLAVCYGALHRQDISLNFAVGILRRMHPEVRDEVNRYVMKILEHSGGTAVDLLEGRKFERVIRELLQVLGVDWGSKPGDREPIYGEWGSERRMWEIRKFCGMVWYAMKVLDNKVDQFAETIPDYAVRMSDNVVTKNMTILLPYFPERRFLRENIHRYLNQLYDLRIWKRVAPLVWIVQPARINNQVMPEELWEAPAFRPKFIMIEVGQQQFAIYRYFDHHNDEFEAFLIAMWRMGKYELGTPSRVSDAEMQEFYNLAGANTLEKRVEMSKKIRDAADKVRNGRLSGEVRFMYACLEVGIEMAWNSKEGGYLAVSEFVDRRPPRDQSVTRGRERKDSSASKKERVQIMSKSKSAVIMDELKAMLVKRVVVRRLLGYSTAERYSWAQWEVELVRLRYPYTRPGYDIPTPDPVEKFPWSKTYDNLDFKKSELGRMSDAWKNDLIRRVGRDRYVIAKGLYGGPNGKGIKELKKRDKCWYGSWKNRDSAWEILGFGGKKGVGPKEKMRIKKVEVLGIESREVWEEARKEGLLRRVFE